MSSLFPAHFKVYAVTLSQEFSRLLSLLPCTPNSTVWRRSGEVLEGVTLELASGSSNPSSPLRVNDPEKVMWTLLGFGPLVCKRGK